MVHIKFSAKKSCIFYGLSVLSSHLNVLYLVPASSDTFKSEYCLFSLMPQVLKNRQKC